MNTNVSNLIRPLMLCAAAYVLIVICEIGIHYLMVGHSAGAGTLLAFYTYRDPRNGKGNSDTLDIVMPSIIFGIIMGFVGQKWPAKKLLLCVLFGTMGIVFLLPFYTLIIGKDLVWWWPRTNGQAIVFQLLEFPKVLLLSAVCLFGVRKVFSK